MLHSYNDLKTYNILAADGRSGRVDDLYFDDSNWQVRYLVAHSGFLLTGRQGLVAADRLGAPDTATQEVPVNLTVEELKAAKSPDADVPVSRQSASSETPDFALWPSFLVGSGVPYSPEVAMEQLEYGKEHLVEKQYDPHLRSMAEVADYTVAASDGDIGSVIDFLINPEDWRLHFLVVDTGNWLPGRRVVVTTAWITEVDWTDRKIHVDVDQQAIEDAPRLSNVSELKRSTAQEAIEQYGYVGYWPI